MMLRVLTRPAGVRALPVAVVVCRERVCLQQRARIVAELGKEVELGLAQRVFVAGEMQRDVLREFGISAEEDHAEQTKRVLSVAAREHAAAATTATARCRQWRQALAPTRRALLG